MHDQEWSKNDRTADGGSSTVSPKLIGWIVVAALGVTFILQNRADAKVKGIFWTIDTSMWVIIVISMVLGGLLVWLGPKLLRRRDR